MTAAAVEEVNDRPWFERATCWSGPKLLATTFPPLRWAVHGLIPAGLSLFVGAPKVGKSWATLDIALAVASGGKALGALDVDAGRVLFLALEDGPRRLKGRLRLLLGDDNPAPEHFEAYVDWPRGAEAVRAAWEWCDAHGDARLVVVDTLARVRAPSTGKQQAYAEDTAALTPWQKLAEHFGVAVVIVHHDRKADSGDFVDSVSGTHGLAGVADTTVVLDRARMEDYGRLRLTGRDVPEAEVSLRRAGPAWVAHDGPPPEPDLGADMQAVLAAVHRHEGPAKAADVVAATGLHDGTVRRYLARLVDSQRLTKTGRGSYAPVTSVPGVSTTYLDKTPETEETGVLEGWQP